MKTPKKQILVGVFLSITIVTSTAQAGFLDLFKVQADKASDVSLDQFFYSLPNTSEVSNEKLATITNAVVSTNSPVGDTPKTVRKTYTVQVSGYNSEVGQTDDSPFIGAMGTHVRDGMVAANMLPFRTAIKFKNCGGIDPNKVFIVEDRMNKRYQNNVDIWFADHSVAVKFGRRTCQIEVL